MYALRRSIHQSWLLACGFSGIVIGSSVAFWPERPVYVPIMVVISVLAVAVVCLMKRQVWLVAFMIVAGAVVGLWRAGNYRLDLAPYTRLEGQAVTIRGKVIDDADTSEHGEIVLRVGDIGISAHGVAGKIWISSTTKAAIKRGDVVTVKGKIAAGFGSFAASMYRADVQKVERPEPGDVALRLRDWFSSAIRTAIREPEASLGVGFLVGERRSLPDTLDKALKAAGLTHIVVASGYNLTILVGIGRRLLAKYSKFLAVFCSGGLIISFIAITGMSPSMSRAGLVTGLSLLAWQYGRKFHPLVLLFLAAAVTVLIDPSYAHNDLGWQLSFASFAGVLLVGPLLQEYFFGKESRGVIRQVLIETMSAWLCTVPLIIMAFGQFSNVAIIANILILPLVPLAMLLTFIAGVITLLIPPLATLAGIPAFLVLSYMTHITLFLGNLPWAQTELTLNPILFIAYYILLIGGCGYMVYRTRFRFVALHHKEAQ